MTRLFTIVFIIFHVIVHGQSLKPLSIAEQIEDITFIKNELQEFHPGIYTYQTEFEFEAHFDSLIANLKPNQTVFQFYNRLIPVINQIGCGHTTAKLPTKELKRIQKNRKFIPIEIKIINNKFFITNVFVENNFLVPGVEILSIDGSTANDYINSNLNRYPSDGRILSRKYQTMEKNFSFDYNLFHYTSDDCIVEVMHKGERIRICLPGITFDDFIAKSKQTNSVDLELQIIDSLSLAIITVRNSSLKKIFNSFLENSFEKILSKKINNLVIDVRFDSFNRDSDGAELYAYLTIEPFNYYSTLEVTENYDVPKALRWITHYPIGEDSTGKFYWKVHPQLELQIPKSNPFLGNVYVLTDGFTFSATSEFSSIVKSNKRGLIVGVETGGGYYGNNSGGMLRKILPNSGIKIYIPPIKYHMAVKDLGNYTRGVIPDTLVTENIHDIVLQNDVVLKAALEIIYTDNLKLYK
ncbi:MAG: S41 family peptidase [Bacteroidales bacterium]|jgi:hypothetical protein|nr:S41 family peptidase [Bacteroidales bacterium]